MRRSCGVLGLIATTSTGCGVGGVNSDPNQLLCAAPVTITGTFSQEAEQPDEIAGCWPIGTWSFTIAVGEGDCGEVPAPLANYAIRFERDTTAAQPDYVWISSYLTDPDDAWAEVSVTSGGGGLCEADVQIYGPDGTAVWNLHPALQADATINGQGEYMLYSGDQRREPEE